MKEISLVFIVALSVFVVSGLSACSWRQKNEKSDTVVEEKPSVAVVHEYHTIDPVLLLPDELASLKSKGEYLLEIAACGVCHSANGKPGTALSGGRMLHDEIGDVVVPNITSDNETGIGKWSVGDIKKAIREGVSRGGRLLSPLAHSTYRWLSDEDASALAIYLQSTEPRMNVIEPRVVTDFQHKKWGLISQHSEIQGYVPTLPEKAAGYRGLYLTTFVQNCSRCHSPLESMADQSNFLDGHEGKLHFNPSEDSLVVPSIRSNDKGIKNWTEEKIINYLSESSEKKICPTNFYSKLTDADKKAIAVYLISLK